MTSPTDRARDRDRDAAVGIVNAAFASGRIVEADRDKRVQEIQRAHSLQDISVQLGELAPPAPVPAYSAPLTTAAYAPPTAAGYAPPTASGAPAPAGPAAPPSAAPSYASSAGVPYGPATATAPGSGAGRPAARAGRRIAGVAMAVALVSVVVPIAGVVIALVSSSRSFDFQGSTGTTPTDGTTYLPGQPPGAHGVNVLTTDGFKAMVDAVAAKTGSTSVYLAVAYPTYAVVEAPDSSGAGHYAAYYWNGHALTGQQSLGSTTDQPIDLAAVDPQVMIDQLTTVRGRVTDPDSWYCLAQASQGTPQISCYASNKYSDSTYTVVGLDGTLIYDSAASS